MITKIKIENVASFKQPTSIDINKKFSLFYGLNGTGKTTISNYLYNLGSGLDNANYANCKIDGYNPNDTNILVYNQKFIQDNFVANNEINGIFTLSKENKEVEKKINQLKNEKEKKEKEKIGHQNKKTEKEEEKKKCQNEIYETTWKIKKKYEHDTELNFCLNGFKGSKMNIFDKLNDTPYVDDKKIDIEALRQGAKSVLDEAQEVSEIKEISFPTDEIKIHEIESDTLFAKQIVGNKNSSISEFIARFQNSDWIKTGFEKHIKHHPDNETCPFCYQKTITEDWKKDIENYFDESYQKDIAKLKERQTKYEQLIQEVTSQISRIEKENIFFEKYKTDFELKYEKFHKILTNNQKHIQDKIQNPSHSVILEDSISQLQELHTIIHEINTKIQVHKKDIANKEATKEQIKTDFWNIMRRQYNDVIELFQMQTKELQTNIDTLTTQIQKITSEIHSYDEQITEQQKNTVNIDEAITYINKHLQDIGITGFSIKKYTYDKRDYFYRIKRDEENETNNDESKKVFKTLSEGEKMLISFLYFMELCRGKKQENQIEKKKIIAIDDPISSLSHDHVFNIAQFIKREFFTNTYEQVFLLTHNLYFFNELRKKIIKQKPQLIRITKGKSGSELHSMDTNEILNDYQAYWEIIKNHNSYHHTVLANSMRNILEYFFGFIAKKELGELFREELKGDIKYRAFYRYINRESHSDMENIFDMKDFDYKMWQEYFQDIFKKTGHIEHYNIMMGEEEKTEEHK